MALSIEANLDLVIDGQAATLTGSGKVLRLTLDSTKTLRALRSVSLPVLPGRAPTLKDLPGVLAEQGLTLELADAQGLLLTLGKGAGGSGCTVPGWGRLEHVALAGKRAALRLALNA